MPGMLVVVSYLVFGFKLWMILDASRRRVHALWYLVVLLPLGDLVYFFAVKLRDFNVHPGPPPEVRPSELSLLEREAEASPSFHNRVRLGWALLDFDKAERAQGYFEEARKTHPNDPEAMFGVGLAQLARGNNQAAAATLSQLVERSPAYEHYEAALALAEALFRAGEHDESLSVLSRVIAGSGELKHRLLLARYQLRASEREQAQVTLRRAIDAFEAQPDFVRQRNGALATEARRLLRTLEEQIG
jgi:tetratricopeptide (TPR) repeat protein